MGDYAFPKVHEINPHSKWLALNRPARHSFLFAIYVPGVTASVMATTRDMWNCPTDPRFYIILQITACLRLKNKLVYPQSDPS